MVQPITASSTQEGVIFNTPGWIKKGEEGIWVVKVNNASGVELPSTGASHPLAFTLAGLTMVGAVGAVLHFRKKDEE